jgi:chromate reductase
MSEPLTVLCLPGSLRRGSLNRGILEAAAEVAPEDLRLSINDLRDIPLYNGDVEKEGVPDSVQRLAAAIRDSDAVLIATPEYNAGIPGVLKNALDWVSRATVGSPMREKQTGILGVSPGRFATARAQEQLKLVLLSMKSRVFVGGSVAVGQAGNKYEGGRLVDEQTRDFLARYLNQFAQWIESEIPA